MVNMTYKQNEIDKAKKAVEQLKEAVNFGSVSTRKTSITYLLNKLQDGMEDMTNVEFNYELSLIWKQINIK